MAQPEFRRYEQQSVLQKQAANSYAWATGVGWRTAWLCVFMCILADLYVFYQVARSPGDYFAFTIMAVIMETARPLLLLALVASDRVRSEAFAAIALFLLILSCIGAIYVLLGMAYFQLGNLPLILMLFTVMCLGAGLPTVITLASRSYEPSYESDLAWVPGQVIDATPVAATEPVRIERADRVAPEKRDWLVQGMIGYGEITILAGPGGCGKTTSGVSIVAAATAGGMLPDGSSVKPARALIVEAEDSIETETIPDLIYSGADLSRVHVTPHLGDEPVTGEVLEKYAGTLPPHSIVMLSPIRALLQDSGLPYNVVWQRMTDLARWAKRRQIALILIMHPVKGKENVLAGSDAYISRTRMLLMIDKSNPEATAFRIHKSNIGIVGRKFHYRIEGEGGPGSVEGAKRVVWLPSLNHEGPPSLSLEDGRADEKRLERSPIDQEMEMHAVRANGGQRGANVVEFAPHALHAPHASGSRVDVWLRDQLKDGPKRFSDLMQKAFDEDICARRTLFDSAGRIGVKMKKLRGNQSEWSL